MTTETRPRVPLADALRVAQALEQQLCECCERVVIAGSIRRQMTAPRGSLEGRTVKDVELVAIPKPSPTALWGDDSPDPARVRQMLTQELGCTLEKAGDRYVRFAWGGMDVDLFLTTPQRWGATLVLRTGPASYSHWLVTSRLEGGGCPVGVQWKDGELLRGGVALAVPTERHVFATLGLDYVEPFERVSP